MKDIHYSKLLLLEEPCLMFLLDLGREGARKTNLKAVDHGFLDQRDKRSLVRLVWTNRKTQLGDLTNIFNQHGCKQVSKRTIQ